jgi:FMN phosphatase YigB (HAD superfamily)
VLSQDEVVFLLDVDNTLLDNDRFGADLGERLEQSFGAEQRARYWTLFAALRDELSYADYLAALQQFRAGLDDDPHLLQMSAFMLEYPFADRLYPRALEVIAHLDSLGLPVVLSDGDVVFQPRKIQRSGIWDAVHGRVLIYVHKERALDAMQTHYAAPHYVMVDDKPRVLAAMKRELGARLTTVFVRQGHYAHPSANPSATHGANPLVSSSADTLIDPPPDLMIERIGDLLDHDLADFHTASPLGATATDLELT